MPHLMPHSPFALVSSSGFPVPSSGASMRAASRGGALHPLARPGEISPGIGLDGDGDVPEFPREFSHCVGG